jgi:hypothetical protein
MTASEQIIQVIDALCTKFGIAIDWTSENVIPYVETLCGKLINYEILTSVFVMVIWLALGIGGIVAIKKFTPVFKRGLENRRSWEIGWEFATVFSIVGLVILYITTIIVVSDEIMDIIKCIMFPEMYVFEYVQKLVNAG